MRSTFGAIFNFLLGIPTAITPRFVKYRADPERVSIDRFVANEVVPSLTAGELLLDAGAGRRQFKPLIEKAGVRYESTDFAQVFHEDAKGLHDFVCSLDAIPKADGTYDAILNTQVLEHVAYPQKVIDELYRILKPGGRLYLSTNQMFHLHHPPHNYFYFTRFGLEHLFKTAGFGDIQIEERGGIFYVLGKILNTLPPYLYYQIAFTGFKRHSGFKPKLRSPLLAVVLLPVYLVAQLIVGLWLPFLFFYVDRIDCQRYFTLGHACVAVKPNVLPHGSQQNK